MNVCQDDDEDGDGDADGDDSDSGWPGWRILEPEWTLERLHANPQAPPLSGVKE